MTRRSYTKLDALRFVLTLAGGTLLAGAAFAHPHVFVTSRMVIEFKDGALKDLRHAWTFDETYATSAIEGLDTNKDGNYDREELKALAQVNVDGLKEFGYFTFATAGGDPLEFGVPENYWLEYANNLLTLHFSLPLAKPIDAKGKALKFTVQDETYFIAFEFEKADAVKLSGNTPSACRIVPPAAAQETASQKLSDAFSAQLGAPGGEAVNTVDVQC